MAVALAVPESLLPIAGVRIGTTRAIRAKRRDDLTLMALAPGCRVAAVFTQNRYPAPPVSVCREYLARPGAAEEVRGLAINAGIANAGTLGEGVRDARECCRLAAEWLACEARQVLPFSTGVIMERLPMARYAEGLGRCAEGLEADNWAAAARAIMTTDTVPKGMSAEVDGGARVTGIAKGSGMIHPNMATMLAFVATDAAVEAAELRRWQKLMVAETFNTISVDGDTSTNDSFVLAATGRGGGGRTRGERRALREALMRVCAHLAEAIVRDGEGATRLARIEVRGAANAVCRRVAESVARSPLVKTALAAGDANVGRFLMAIGNVRGGFAPEAVAMTIGGVPVLASGGRDPRYDEDGAAAAMGAEEVTIAIDLGGGGGGVRMLTCDLTREYVRINAEYRS